MMNAAAQPQRSRILGAPVDVIDRGGALRIVAGWVGADDGSGGEDRPRRAGRDGGLHHIVTVNPEFVIAARRNPEFARVLNAAALATADGVGIVLAGRMLGVPTGPRVTGVELVEGLAGLGAPGVRLFLLGAGPDIAEQAAAKLRQRHPSVQIVGTFAGSSTDAGLAEVEERLANSGATVLLVAFGHPTQDLWIARHRERLEAHGILVAAGIGGAFDYLSGRVPRAPSVVRRLGLEWLYRLIRQPWRWRRQLALPLFVALVVRERVVRGWGQRAEDGG
jgi:N-acetylglucosaminyldiphosphoundecaprenol N-acetyl-beta-D-mannosaminyltransferase